MILDKNSIYIYIFKRKWYYRSHDNLHDASICIKKRKLCSSIYHVIILYVCLPRNNYHCPHRSLSIHFPSSLTLSLSLKRASNTLLEEWFPSFHTYPVTACLSLRPFSQVFFCRGYLSRATRQSVDTRLSREVARETVTATCWQRFRFGFGEIGTRQMA